jgi:TolB-like protein
MRSIIHEIKRRNVHRAAIAYLAASWLLVQLLETIFPIYGFDESGIRWVILALIIGFFPLLGLSWAFEWSPGGLRSQSDIDRDPDAEQSAGRTLDRVIIGVLSMAVLFFAVDRFLLHPRVGPAAPDSQTIAVLPFTDMTAAQDQAYFADGLADELLNLLAKNSALRVAARTSSFSFRDATLPIGEIARQLRVKHVVEGSVRRDGDRIRVIAQLIDADDGYHVWSETYDQPFTDIFQIQDQISLQIAVALETSVLDEDRAERHTDSEAYAYFLQAKYHSRAGSPESLEKAAALFQEALAIAPDYAPAWAGLATTYSNLAGQGHWDWDEGFKAAGDAAQRAVDVDPDYAGGHLQLAWLSHRYDGDLGAAISHMQDALELAPENLSTIRAAAVLLLQLGRADDAIEALRYYADRSPIEPSAFYNLGVAYVYARRLREAERSFRKVLELNKDYPGATYYLGETLLLADKPQEALQIWENLDGYNLSKGRALAYFDLGRQQESDAALDELISGWGEQWPSIVVDVHAYRGDIDQAFEWLDKDYEKFGAAGWGEIKLQRLPENLHNDPRWSTFLKRAGVTDEQLSVYKLDITVPSS